VSNQSGAAHDAVDVVVVVLEAKARRQGLLWDVIALVVGCDTWWQSRMAWQVVVGATIAKDRHVTEI
jgi:hypothetical protein